MSGSKKTVIIIDDESITRMDLSEMLEEIGYIVVGTAADGFDGVELCRQLNPNLVLMDIKMPIFDGLTAADTIVREGLAECIILLTAYNNQDFIERAKRIGVNGYIVKPVESRTLLPAIEVAMAQSARLRESQKETADALSRVKQNILINRAKSIIAQQNNTTEAEAYAYLRKMAMDKRSTIAVLAEAIVSSNSKREIINRAKDILMRTKKMSEEEAYKFIVDEAKNKGWLIVEYARMIMEKQR